MNIQMLCLSLKSWIVWGIFSCCLSYGKKKQCSYLRAAWESSRMTACPSRRFLRPGLWHSSLSVDFQKLCSLVFLLVMELLTYPKMSFNLSSSKLLSSVDNKELREEKDILYSSDVWAIITEIEACVLFLRLYWWSQVKGLVIYIYFFWLKITHAWSRQHSLVHDSDNFSVQGQIVNICGEASHCICESVLQLGDCPCSVKAVADE